MENNNYIKEELGGISPFVAKIDKLNVFSVSPLYFENLSAEVVRKINSGIEPTYWFTNQTPYKVPQKYFENFAEKLLEKLTSDKNEVFDEMEEISPLLNTISKKPVFSVPEGFFQEVKTPDETFKPEAKVVSIKSAPRKWMNYTIAAVIATVIAVGAFLFSGPETKTLQNRNNFSKVEVKHLSEQEITDFLNKNSLPYEVSASNIKDKESNISRAIKEVTDKEIQQFLQDNAIADEI